jgi:hypothetical protein
LRFYLEYYSKIKQRINETPRSDEIGNWYTTGLLNFKPMHHCFRKNDSEWNRLDESVFSSRDVWYNIRTYF